MIESLYQKYKESSGVCTDTRKIESGNIFFALKGGNFNGNKFAAQALVSGASFAIIDEAEFKEDDRFIVVDDVLKALQQLANHHRKQFSFPFIGITGSNGKTTTKELMNAVLSKKFKVHYTQGNLNNHIGVPLTLLAMPEDTEIAVIEMGANHIGEIEFLCGIAEPSHGLITNIGKAHLEGFGGLEGVARGKSELYLHLMKNGGQVFVNATDEHLDRMSKRLTSPLYYLKEGSYCNPKLISATPQVVFEYEGVVVETQIVGGYNFNNIAAALCIAKFFGVSTEDANAAIAEYVSDNNRSQVIEKGTNTILLDAYNANPSSMRAAIENFDRMEAENKVMILGDMFEMGDQSQREHREIADLARSIGSTVYLVGKEFTRYADGFADTDQLLTELKSANISHSTILIKGSRGMKLEGVVDFF